MSALVDLDVLKAAICQVSEHPEHIPGLLHANGATLEDCGMVPQFQAILAQLRDAHTRGERPAREVMISRLVEATPFKDRDDWEKVFTDLDNRGREDSIPLFLDHLASLRLRRRLVEVGMHAQNGWKDSDLIAGADEAKADHGRTPGAPSKLEPIKIGTYDPEERPPVLCGDPDGDVPIAAGDLVEFVGEVGAGKTISQLDLGIAAAFAQPFLGFPIANPLRVMVVLADGDGEKPSKRRAARLAIGRDLAPADLDTCGRLRIITPDNFSLDDAHDFADLVQRLQDFDPDLLCIETVASLMGPERDSWHPGAAADFIGTRLRPLQKRPDGSRRTLVLGTHLTKRSKDKGGGRLKDRVQGSFYMLGGADAALSFDEAGDEAFKVRPLKRSRWGTTFRPFLAIVTGNKGEPLRLVNNGFLAASKGERSAEETDLMRDLAALDGPDGFVPLAEVKRRRGIDKSDGKDAKALDRTAKRLAKRGALEAGPRGLYRIVKSEEPELDE